MLIVKPLFAAVTVYGGVLMDILPHTVQTSIARTVPCCELLLLCKHTEPSHSYLHGGKGVKIT